MDKNEIPDMLAIPSLTPALHCFPLFSALACIIRWLEDVVLLFAAFTRVSVYTQ